MPKRQSRKLVVSTQGVTHFKVLMDRSTSSRKGAEEAVVPVKMHQLEALV